MDVPSDRVQLPPADQRDGASAEPASGHARPDDAGLGGQLDQQIQLLATDLIVVPQRDVAGVHQPADRGPVAAPDRLGRRDRPADFADDVPRPAVMHGVEPATRRFQLFPANVAQGGNAEGVRGLLTLAAAGRVAAVGQGVAHVAVDDQGDDFRVGQRRQPDGARAAVQQEQGAVTPHYGGALVHNAAGHAGEVVFRLLAEQRLLEGIKRFVGHRLQECSGGHLKRGATGQAAARRNVGGDDGLEGAGG